MAKQSSEGDWIRSKADERAVERGCHFDERSAEKARLFFSRFLRHSKGKFAGKPFELQEWQWRDVIAPCFGWKRPDGTRRYRRLSVWVPKKNGKSTLASGLILYGLVADGEQGAEVYGAAADRNQAAIIFGEVAAMVSQSPSLAGRLKINQSLKRVVCPATNSFYQVLSKDSRRSGHGINAHVCVIDELHVVDRDLHDTLRYAGAARSQPLLVEISTAGNDKTSLGYERYQYAKRLIRGEIEDDETLAVVYEADSPEAWEDPQQWQKANPSLGTTITQDGFRGDFAEAKNAGAATQANFKQLRLNLWQDQLFAWIPLEQWDACRVTAEIEPQSLIGLPCWGGVDLASKMDLCAWVIVWQLPSGEYYARSRFWCPQAARGRRARENKAGLLPWIRSGQITETPGDVTDYDAIEKQVIADCEQYLVQDVAYDPWNAAQFATHLQAAGVKVVQFGQTIRNYNEPMKEAERLVQGGKLKHDGNEVLRWMVGHTSARKDASGNVRPDKESSADHIDGVTAMLMALGRAMVEPDQGASVYDTRGIEVIG